MQINEVPKTKLMLATSAALPTTSHNLRGHDVQIVECTFEVAQEFICLKGQGLATIIAWKLSSAKMLAVNRSFYSLRKQFTSNNLSRRTNLGLYSTYIVPVLTYASETWTLSKSDVSLLATFESKMIRSILGPVCVEGLCRTCFKDELYEMYGDLTIVHRIKLVRLQ